MRTFTKNILSATDYEDSFSEQIDASQIRSATFQIIAGDTTVNARVSLQVSNDPPPYGVPPNTFIVEHWNILPSQNPIFVNGRVPLLRVNPNSYRWLRVRFAVRGSYWQRITTVSDVSGSLNSTYFLLQDTDSANLYYVWFSINGAGVDPNILGRVGVKIEEPTNASADVIALDLATAIANLNSGLSFITTYGVGGNVDVTCEEQGPCAPMSDGANPTHFTFSVIQGGSSTVNVTMTAYGF